MPPLPTQLRNRLEAAVKQARRTAEAAAKVALERLTVGAARAGEHLTENEQDLRKKLRAHGRQLGDKRDEAKETQSINRLIHECAYEHWHRMLFARFLAENHLLIHEKEGMPVTLAECDELARDESADDADGRRLENEVKENLRKSAQSADKKPAEDGWALAARYAARMLPQIFRPDDPVLQVGFAPEHKRAVEKLVTELPVEVFTAEDSLGWVYQFWQAERKDEVNASGDKITGETLPAVTQLFTEHYMVLFLLHNTIGAWWSGKRLSADDADLHRLETEEEVRKALSLPGYEFSYLRLIREEVPTGEQGETENLRSSSQSADKRYRWKPAAGSFPGWPKSLKDFKLLDPCCGSGHFLIAAFVLLVRLRMQDEKLSAKDACDAVLRENLHGLEIDARCTQIAAFALALAAWKFPNVPAPVGDDVRSLNPSSAANGNQSLLTSAPTNPIGYRALPPLNIACSGLGVNAKKEDWLALANGDTRLRSGLEQLYDLFQKAPELGSLINPRRLAHGDLVTASFAEIQPLLTKAIQSESAKRNDDLNEIGVAAQGMVKAAELLGSNFTLVSTNVPYLGRAKQNKTLQDFSESVYPEAKADIATCFVERCIEFCSEGGMTALVSPQNWFFLGGYKVLRVQLLRTKQWVSVARLGTGAFEMISGEVVNVALVTICRTIPHNQEFFGIDVSGLKSPSEKATTLSCANLLLLKQSDQIANPDSAIVLGQIARLPPLNRIAGVNYGSKPGQTARVTRCFWELGAVDGVYWRLMESSPTSTSLYSGKAEVCLSQAEIEKQGIVEFGIRGSSAWGKRGVIFAKMSQLSAAVYVGQFYDDNTYTIIPKHPSDLPALIAYTTSDSFFGSSPKLVGKKGTGKWV